MRTTAQRSALPAWLFCGFAAAATAFAGPPPEPPPFHAIENVRVEVGDGTVLERATVVIENGTISAVAQDAEIPAHAWVIDGAGLTVYPGLIDALGSLPSPRRATGGPDADRTGRRRGRGDPSAELPRGPEDRPQTTPWKRAADDLSLDPDAVGKWREAGFTSIAARPGDGLFPGRVSLVRLGTPGRDPEHQVVAPALAQVASLDAGGGFGSYPGSVMGRIAYFRQVLLDAAHHSAAVAAYEADPTGWSRPEFDRTLAPLAGAASGSEPILLPGSSAVEIARALSLGREFGLDFMIYGGQEAYRVAPDLAAAGVAVLVDVDWPTPLPESDRDPESDRPLRDVLHERLAPTTPVELAEAGVQFALTSGGGNGADDLLTGVRRAVEGGLEPARALTALTRDAAAVHGLDDRLGTVAPGMAADLVLADGWPWQESTRIRSVFINGVRYRQMRDSDEENGGDDGENADQAAAGEARGGGRGGGSKDAPTPMRLSEVASRHAEIAGDAMVPMTGPYRQDDVVAIAGGTVLTMAGETIPNGTVIVRDGRIAEVGAGISPPQGAHVIDASGGFVMPGIVDAHSHIAAEGGINEGSLAVTSMVRIGDVVDPTDVSIYRALAGGVTTINLLHGSANPIGGHNEILKMRWGMDADGMRFQGAPPGIKFALGENPKRSRTFGPGPRRYPVTRMGVLDVIREAFTEAIEYRAAWERHGAAEAAGRRSRSPGRDLKLDALVEILAGERLVHAHCYRGDEILQLLRLAEEIGFQVATLQHVLEGYRVADEIAAHGAGASTFSDWWAFKVEAYEAIPYNAALMAERGVLVSINSDDAEEMRHLNHEAAKAVRWGGMSDDDALSLITINPARQLGIEHRVGSIEVGKDADLVIYDRHPLSSMAVVQSTLLDGKLWFDRELDRLRREQLDALEASLLQAPSGEGEAAGDADGEAPADAGDPAARASGGGRR